MSALNAVGGTLRQAQPDLRIHPRKKIKNQTLNTKNPKSEIRTIAIFRKILTFLTRLRSGAIELSTGRYDRQVAAIAAREQEFAALTDDGLKQRSTALRERIRVGTSSNDLVIDAFALIKEIARRTVGMFPYDVQVLAAVAIHDRKLVEMQTGEGKTLAAVLPAALAAFQGRGVHVLTYNDYLASRDARWMGPIYHFLGLSVGHVAQGLVPDERRAAYACDVTYLTAKEAGFDFLRDQACLDLPQLVQRGFHFAIVDEADSILIDEARVPLVIAGAEDEQHGDLHRLAGLVRTLQSNADYAIVKGWRNVNFTTAGLNRLQKSLQCGELHSEQNADLFTRLNLALQAEVLLRRDVDYLVRDGQVELVDELTGRVAENRRWPYGLQAAIEAKEGLVIQPQGRILNSITLQHFLEQYASIAGMTGTAQDAAVELHDFYKLTVVIVPPNRPCLRIDHPDSVFRTKAAKFAALVLEIAHLHQTGRPVLVGTTSVAESEHLAARLAESGTSCRVLNARNDADEAAVVAEAGAPGAVTISTNMAGRGTDIRLGGSDERDRDRVVELGGLFVIGTNRHESRRIDNQLRGRAGRQGDPGESRFFVSLEDDLIHRHGIADFLAGLADRSGNLQDDPTVGREIAHVQRVIEGESLEIRRTLRKYSYCLERQRRLIYERRNKLLHDLETPELLRRVEPELFERLADEFGEDVVLLAERQVTLFQIDRCWSDYLSHVAEIREGIHLVSFGGLDAFDEFNRQINAAFRELLQRLDTQVVATLRTARITPDGVDLAAEGLLGPSSTWTYLINDTPMGDILQRLLRGLKRFVTADPADDDDEEDVKSEE
ncbi:MAG: accessory Sec system translocase SecA2 [Planctomycetia bacterium]|nr:accessory Sec system translocase SecA2 [Planctomycetia bacterium]